jgi:alpha,alpha-trehalase
MSEIIVPLPINYSFSILHSPFSILHSPFSILHSPFSILHSPFSILPLTRPPAPDTELAELFVDVQLGGVFVDSKTFVDCVPLEPVEAVLAAYRQEKDQPGFDLRAFVFAHFEVPAPVHSDFTSDTTGPTRAHIERLWDVLTRPADVPVAGSSRVPLPHPYVVPGGRFREIFYWDSYFTMLGLARSGRLDLIRGMLDNFAYLIEQFGFIPNGNRTYFLSRSQPPFFALMVDLLADLDGPEALRRYLPALAREYAFWMEGTPELSDDTPAYRRVVRVPGGVLNRYWDDTPRPRPEAYRPEIELTERASGVPPERLYRHIRAACESGWDFSSRWFADGHDMTTIRTADLVPVDLNALLYSLETTLQAAYTHTGDAGNAATFAGRADTRRTLLRQTCWNESLGFFTDYDYAAKVPTTERTLAGVTPLFFGLATPEQAASVHDQLLREFLQSGGWVTTLRESGQQWDWPNGWAPLQWLTHEGLRRYGFGETAREGRRRWLDLNDRVFAATGKLMEKYDVVNADLTAGGGEYPNQDGFGWTNGVYLALGERE